jgi:hypothetical protein
MTIRIYFTFFALAFFMATGVMAQTLNFKEIPPPTAPFVAVFPENGDWLVSTKLTALPAPAPDQPVIPGKVDRRIASIHVVKTGKTRFEQKIYGSHEMSERWYVDSYCLYALPGQPVRAVDLSNMTDGEGRPVAAVTAFYGVEWVTSQYYDKVEPKEKIPCYHYVFGVREAWIAVQTRLPVAYKDAAGLLYTYTFNSPPENPMTLPEAYAKAWQELQQWIKARQ